MKRSDQMEKLLGHSSNIRVYLFKLLSEGSCKQCIYIIFVKQGFFHIIL